MKKKISILIILTLILNLALNIFGNISFAATNIKKENEKKNPESYWSTKNAPLFYGATKITLKKGIIDEFNVLDSRFRIFAKDFEDGDLTPNITSSGEVKVDEVGDYEIIYSVTDSHNNKTTLTVPVIVTDNENTKITVERTIYTTPSVWNMDLAEFSRCNYGDRQILGIYLSSNQSVQARIISSENNLSIGFINNDQYNETSTTLPTTGEWITLQNVKDNNGFDGVPLLKTTVLSKQNTSINKTLKIELQYNETIEPLNYYHYLDNETEFRTKWTESANRYGVIESDTLLLVVPFTDMRYMTNYYNNGFKSLDQFLEYYQKVIEKMDEYIGLDFNPEKITDQNVRTKYLVRANVHGVGAAYYAGDHIGVNNSSMASFFEMNWGGLHEIAHGYQGSLGKGEMLLGEVSNNILGHYIQIDKSIYFHSGNWLGELSAIEDARNSQRLSGKTFLQIDEPSRLYVIINLLNSFEGGTTYGKMFSWYREQLYNGRTMTNQYAYVEAIADIYNINIIPYMEAWGLNISESVKVKVYSENYPLINILKDMVSETSLETIMNSEGLDRKYSLVSNKLLQKYNITGNMTLNINIDDINQIQGKISLLKHGNNIIKSIQINNNLIEEILLPVGTYFIQMPILTGYSQEYIYVQIKESLDNTYTYTYEKTANIDYDNYLMFRLLGYNYDTIAYQLTFKENYTKAEIKYPNQSAMSGKEYVKIYDNEGELVTEDISTGGYFNFNKGTHEINLQPGYTIEINYPIKYANKVVVYNTLTNTKMPEYEQLKVILIDIIENYKQKVTEDELNNKFINHKEKATVIDAYNQLRDDDKIPYTTLINSIKRAGIPTITVIAETLKYDIGTQIDLYSLIKAVDNEDGPILIDKNNTTIKTKLDVNNSSIYNVTYEVSDSDKNVSTKTIQIEIIDNTIPPDEEEKPLPPEEGEEEIVPPIPPETGEDNDEDEITPPEEDEGNNGSEVTPPETDEDDKEDVITPPETDNNESNDVVTPPIIEEKPEIKPSSPNISQNTEIETISTEEDTNQTIQSNFPISDKIENAEDSNISNLNTDIENYAKEESEIIEKHANIETEELPQTVEDNNIFVKILLVLIVISPISYFAFRKKFKRI